MDLVSEDELDMFINLGPFIKEGTKIVAPKRGLSFITNNDDFVVGAGCIYRPLEWGDLWF